ncbi:cell wall-binding repeat-containing protein [Lihuaxuella thermophila]|uniref:Putative cell wall binding repeat 2 n=1 Tax=Lihuaxuella thermophila TaxID=1173111 RepID=A0A1H8AWS5_9BACL|nr:cell wall-binding repeat-containing protein [Lihuaxuella thermophila]SEM74394.1 Putative cell wall binding repeat 2 [Lihuaxuella thermophila]
MLRGLKKTIGIVLVGLMLFMVHYNYVSAETTSVTYSGSIDGKAMHTYIFSTSAEGTVTIEDLGTSSSLISYRLESEDAQTSYVSGDVLPEGKYIFKVNSEDTTSGNYSYRISGVPFIGTPDNTLPTLNVTNPTAPLTRLSKGTTTMNVTGSTNGTTASVSVNKNNYSISGSFTKSASLRFGSNAINFKATNANGNSILQSHEVISPGYKRLAGADRFGTSVAISQEVISFFGLEDNEKTIVLANAYNFPDALAGATIATKESAPILLTSADTLNTNVKTEIQRISPVKAIILGGTGAISTTVENELKAMGITTVERIDGINRYEVATNIAQKIVTPDTDTAIIVTGKDFPDGLAVASIAGQLQIPLLLTKSTTLSSEVSTFLLNNPQIKHFVIVGGTVSSTVETQLQTYGTVDRVAGDNRYQTATLTADYFNITPDTVTIANGQDFPDALSGTVLTALLKGPVLLTPPTSTSVDLQNYFEKHTLDIDNMYVLGGTGAVSDTTVQTLNQYIQ